MKIYTSKNISELKNVPVLDNGQVYIYVMLNYPAKNIKIGQTTNIVQRLQSLSGSNGGGNKITILAVSDPTYVINSEKAFHEKYARYRIEGTEWFDGSKLIFEEVVSEMENQFNTKSYEVCNKLRKKLTEKRIREKKEKQKLEEERLKQEELENESKKIKKSKSSKSKRSKTA